MNLNIEQMSFFKGYYGIGQAIVDVSDFQQWLDNFEDYSDAREAVERLNDKSASYYTTEEAEALLGV